MHSLIRMSLKTICAIAMMFCGAYTQEATQEATKTKPIVIKPLKIVNHKLDNGLQVLLIQNTRAPIAKVQLWYKIGARHDPKGKMGLSHFLEHMMFRSKTVCYDFDGFDSELKKMGAGDYHNAATGHDYTMYHESVPVNYLGHLLKLEAARMNSIQLNEKITTEELKVVMQERRMRIDSSASGAFGETVLGSFMLGDALGHSLIGFEHEILSYSQKDLLQLHQNYYGPNNAILVVSSSQPTGQVLKIIKRHFDHIDARPLPDNNIIEQEPKHMPINITVEGSHPEIANPEVMILFKLPGRKFTFKDLLTLKLAMAGLNESDGFFYQHFVKNKKLAASASAWHYGPPLGCLIVGLDCVLNQGKNLAQLKNELQKMIAILQSEPVTQEQFQRTKSLYLRAIMKQHDVLGGTGSLFGSYLVQGFAFKDISNISNIYNEITRDDVNNLLKEIANCKYKLHAVLDKKK